MISWAEVCENPHLKDLPYKIETNRYGKILMSPSSFWHGNLQAKIAHWLEGKMPRGQTATECAIETTDGTRVADVAWISQERLAPHKAAYSLPIAPEICVEILSGSNTREEMLGKMQLYFAAGAKEVWLCHQGGGMEFFAFDASEALASSRLCPDFPAKLDLD